MSYSLKITNGDLDNSTSTMGTISGIDKLTQDLSLWIRERYGIDRFHPDYGSIAESYIGNEINDLNIHELEAEVYRILNIYQQIQLISVQANPGKFTLDELLNTVESVDATPSYDRIYIVVKFTTASGLSGVVTGETTV